MKEITIPMEIFEAAKTLSGAEFRLRKYGMVCDRDEDEEEVDNLRYIALSASEQIRGYCISLEKK